MDVIVIQQVPVLDINDASLSDRKLCRRKVVHLEHGGGHRVVVDVDGRRVRRRVGHRGRVRAQKSCRTFVKVFILRQGRVRTYQMKFAIFYFFLKVQHCKNGHSKII